MASPTLLLRFLPPALEGSEELAAGVVAALQAGRAAVLDMVRQTTVALSADRWLTLLARGYGVVRSTGETDEDLRIRLVNVEDKLTRPSIEAAVTALLATYTATPAEVVEWFAGDGCFWADRDYCDDQRLFGEWHTFYVLVPLLGEMAWGDLYCDEAYCDDEHHVGAGSEHPIYGAIIAAVERLRAAGVRWLLITES